MRLQDYSLEFHFTFSRARNLSFRGRILSYCHCTEPLKLRHYVVGALMPAFILGLIPTVVSLFNGNLMFLILGVFFISAASGDFMVVWILRKESPDNFVQDHPSEAGCYIYRKIN
ncbi:MAG: DUF3267 domain-containing protein [Porphyromonadaceae bacterium]|nr:DUF3267 domain-containing protein [Porphyromonadaceae bacterium]